MTNRLPYKPKIRPLLYEALHEAADVSYAIGSIEGVGFDSLDLRLKMARRHAIRAARSLDDAVKALHDSQR